MELTATVPDEGWRRGLEPLPEPLAGRVLAWDLGGPAPEPAPALVVLPYLLGSARYARLREVPGLVAVQTLTAGYDDVLPHLPDGVSLHHAAGVHDDSTAELAVGLALASLRGLDDAARAMPRGAWEHELRSSLADRRALVVGWGGVGRAVARRLEPFEVSVTAVASRARQDGDGRRVHGVDELPALLPQHDLVVLACPLTDRTRGLLDAPALAALPRGALVVNVSRGAVVDTGALVEALHAGRVRAALDVTDPEPLPRDHPLWSAPGALVSPHMGGDTTAFRPRALRMLRAQLERWARGEPLAHRVA